MAPITPLDIYRHLNKSNCRDCGLPTCMAFAASVLNGAKPIEACPHLDPATAAELAPKAARRLEKEGFQASINALREEFTRLDLREVAQRLGATYTDGLLTLRCLSKDFVISPQGYLESECHVNPWMETLLLSYCTSSATGILSARWVPFAQLSGGATTAPYFARRCENPLKAIADSHTGIFLDLLRLFGGEPMEGFSADHATRLAPLPMMPIILLYTPAEAEEEAAGESTLRVLFEATATDYLGAEVITYMGRGIVEMFQKIISKHQGCSADLLSL